MGKTTLAESISSAYHSLDDEESILHRFDSAPQLLRRLSTSGVVTIDEAQLMPKLFPALKEWVRKHKRPGQFLLSGSVRFTSLKSIRESLTGRIVNLELLPFSVSELEGEPQSDLARRLNELDEFSSREETPQFSGAKYKARESTLERYLEQGGLPGVCFTRRPELREARIRTQLDTILDRDLRLVAPNRLSLVELRFVLAQLAKLQGQVIRVSQVSRTLGVSARVLASVISGLASLFVVRIIPVEGDLKGYSVFFEDCAESRYLTTGEHGQLNRDAAAREHICYLMVRASLAYRSEHDAGFFQFRTRAGVNVPVAVRQNGRVAGWIPIQGSDPDRSEAAAARAFLAAYDRAKVVFVRFTGPGRQVLDSRRMIISAVELTG